MTGPSLPAEDAEPAPAPVTTLKLTTPLAVVPASVFANAATLTHLDLSGTGLAALPDAFADLQALRILFLSNNGFTTFPRVLARCGALEMVAFRGNGMRHVPEDALPPRLRWLILTGNELEALPASIGNCARLQKCMLAGNRLTALPAEMARCRKLGLLRLSANRIEKLPDWLFEMPELAFLSFAGNPCALTGGDPVAEGEVPEPEGEQGHGLPRIPLDSLTVQAMLGEGASGIISKGLWTPASDQEPVDVAIKRFRGAVTSDGTPRDEMRACIRAGPHANLIDPLGAIADADGEGPGLVMQLIPPRYRTLGNPPSLASCTRDCFPAVSTPSLTMDQALEVLIGIASAAEHLHKQGIAHGDLYAHNVLVDPSTGHALLGDFGAASLYGEPVPVLAADPNRFERLDVLAFGHFMEDVWNVARPQLCFGGGEIEASGRLEILHSHCVSLAMDTRPGFRPVVMKLKEIKEALLQDRKDDESLRQESELRGEVVEVQA